MASRAPSPAARPPISTATSCSPMASSSSGRRERRPSLSRKRSRGGAGLFPAPPFFLGLESRIQSTASRGMPLRGPRRPTLFSARRRQRAEMTDERWNVRTALLAALVISSALCPPELSPTGSALAVTLGTGLGVLLLFSDGRARAWTPEENATALVVFAYFGLSVLLSSQAHRSLSCLLGPGMGLVACLAARRETNLPGNRDRI